MPFAGYEDFEDCVSQNRDKGDPEAYCAEVQQRVEKAAGPVMLGPGVDQCTSCFRPFSHDGRIDCGCGRFAKQDLDPVTTMIALYPPGHLSHLLSLPFDGALDPDDLHLTLAFLGDNTQLDANMVEAAMRACESVALRHRPLTLEVVGYDVFGPGDGDTLAATIEADGLVDLREDLTATLQSVGVDYSTDYDFNPHISLAPVQLLGTDDVEARDGLTGEVWQIVLAVGGARIGFSLESGYPDVLLKGLDQDKVMAGLRKMAEDGDDDAEYALTVLEKAQGVPVEQPEVPPPDDGNPVLRIGDSEEEYGWVVRTFRAIAEKLGISLSDVDAEQLRVDYAMSKSAKTNDEERFTFGPLYLPSEDEARPLLDLHDEFATSEDLQKAVWDYVRKDSRDIRLQHFPQVKAGEWVELATWPYEQTIELFTPGRHLEKAEAKTVTVPPNTPFMGVKWQPFAWELVKKGKIRGLSMGGKADRMTVEFEDVDERAFAAVP